MPALERLLPDVGDVLLGRYVLREELNRGAFGLVMTALHQGLDELVTIKILMPHVLTNEDMVRRFEREVILAKALRHPNTIRILDVGRTDDGLPFYVMEHVPGRTLREVIKNDGCLSPERTRRIAIQLLRSLSEAHARGIVHRDLKPGNLLLCDIHGAQDLVKVLDFGVAKGTIASDDDDTVTHTGVAVGTPAYMSPEQARGAQDVDGRSDLYTVGLILTECLTGRRALDVRSLYDAVTLHSRKATPPVAPALKECPLLAVILKATRHVRERRYATADEMCNALENVRGLSIQPLAGVQPPTGRERQDTPLTLPATPTPMSIPDLLPGLVALAAAAAASEAPAPAAVAAPVLLPTSAQAPRRQPAALWVALAAAVVLGAVLTPFIIGSGGGETDSGPNRAGFGAGLSGALLPGGVARNRAERAKLELPPSVERLAVASWDKLAPVVAQADQLLWSAVPPLAPLRIEGTAGAQVSASGRALGELPLLLQHPRLSASVELVAERRGYRPARFELALDGEGAIVELDRARSADDRGGERSRVEGEEEAADHAALPFGRQEAFPAPQTP